eukprot:m.199635 g.199635  ORF g.199635 m.199635 type:complete len:300 (+) comp18393_c1_seq1:406-1305(+)
MQKLRPKVTPRSASEDAFRLEFECLCKLPVVVPAGPWQVTHVTWPYHCAGSTCPPADITLVVAAALGASSATPTFHAIAIHTALCRQSVLATTINTWPATTDNLVAAAKMTQWARRSRPASCRGRRLTTPPPTSSQQLLMLGIQPLVPCRICPRHCCATAPDASCRVGALVLQHQHGQHSPKPKVCLLLAQRITHQPRHLARRWGLSFAVQESADGLDFAEFSRPNKRDHGNFTVHKPLFAVWVHANHRHVHAHHVIVAPRTGSSKCRVVLAASSPKGLKDQDLGRLYNGSKHGNQNGT